MDGMNQHDVSDPKRNKKKIKNCNNEKVMFFSKHIFAQLFFFLKFPKYEF